VGHDRAAGTLDGNRSPDLCRYEAMLRDAAEELLGRSTCDRGNGSGK